jgi:hypothetical protein
MGSWIFLAIELTSFEFFITVTALIFAYQFAGFLACLLAFQLVRLTIPMTRQMQKK